jgi:hypothetical protein
MSEARDAQTDIGRDDDDDTAPWMIRHFSVRLRREIVSAARRADCGVAEWLHDHFKRFGVAGVVFEPPVKPTSRSRPRLHGPPLDDAANLRKEAERITRMLRNALP